MAAPNTDVALLKAQAKRLEMNLDIKDRKYHLKTYKQCFIGKEAILPIINCGFATSESTAVEFGNKLLKANIIAHVEKKHNFKNDCLFYKFIMDLSTANDLDVLLTNRKKLSSIEIEHSTSLQSTNSQTKGSVIYQTMNNMNSNLIPVTVNTQRQRSTDDDLYEDMYRTQIGSQYQNTSPIIKSLQQQIQMLTVKYQKLEARLSTETEKEGSVSIASPGSPTANGIMVTPHIPLTTSTILTDVTNKTPKLMNKWKNWGGTYSDFTVHKIGQVVHLQGCLTGDVMGSVICELPMDCCPSGMMAFCFDQHGGINGRLKIMRDGKIIAEYMNKKWVYLDGITFVTVAVMDEKSDEKNDKGALDVTPKLENGWSNM
eukprot:339625_1